MRGNREIRQTGSYRAIAYLGAAGERDIYVLVHLIGSRNNLRLNRQYHGLKDRPGVGIRNTMNSARTRNTGLVCFTATNLDITCEVLRITGFC